MFGQETLRKYTVALGIDDGGYEVENPDHPALERLGAFVWESPNPDYLPVSEDAARALREGSGLFAFVPTPVWGVRGGPPWPLSFADKAYGHRLVAAGQWIASNRDCHCHGRPDPDEPGGWECTGNVMDKPDKDCDRCGGSGFVEHPAGWWAVFTME